MRSLPELAETIQGAFARSLPGLPRPLLRALVGRPVRSDGQELQIEAQLILRLLTLAGKPPLETLEVAAARARIAAEARSFAGPPDGTVESKPLTVAGASGPLSARLFVPAEAPEPSGLLVYFHGGGFVVCDLDTHDETCRLLAREAGLRVLSVDYRLAPEHRFPAAAEDAVAAFRDVADRATELGADPSRLAVGGDSAGGNLAAVVAQATAARDDGREPALQVLFYPWLDLSRRRSSHALFGDGFFLTNAQLDWYRDSYLADAADAQDPRCSPLLADLPSHLAPAYIATAGFDPLRDEGEAYAERLRDAGVPVALQRHSGLIHGFVNCGSFGHASREALLAACGALRIGLAGRATAGTPA